jgi:tetratricopeptide (TPR) repeat protein
MFNDKNRSNYGIHIRRVKTIQAATVVIVVILLVTVSVPFILGLKNKTVGEKKELLRFWEDGSFDKAFSLSKTALLSKPMDYFMLTIHGFAAYQRGISQINNFDTLTFIDECIWSLRKALLLKDSARDGRVYYVLGKAYAYKGDDYADLTVKYLEKARELSYNAADIPEYLGIAYAAAGDYRSSVEAFSLALRPAAAASSAGISDFANASDLLLVSIARSYMALEEKETAQAYLLQCIEISRDSKTRFTARLLLGEILKDSGDLEGAEGQFTGILEEAGENAEARYQLGELYALKGDTAGARAEWRQTLRKDPAHAKARARLNM